MELTWIREKAREVTGDDAVYEAVINKTPDMQVAIYQGAVHDPELSEASGRMRYKNAPMICKRYVGEKDFVAEPLTAEHRARFPRAWAWWQAQIDKRAKTSVELLPGILPADVAELRELELSDVDALAEAPSVPAELAGWQAMARRLRSLHKPRVRLVDGQLMEVA